MQGIRARGDIMVSMSWDEGGLRHLGLWPGHAGEISLRSAMFEGRFKTGATLRGQGASRSFMAKAGAYYEFNRCDPDPCAK